MPTDSHCQSLMRIFDAQNATIAEMKVYAECVTLLHGRPDVPVALILTIKVLLLLAIGVGLYIGYRGWRDEGPMEGLVNGFMSAFIAFCSTVALALALLFLFTA